MLKSRRLWALVAYVALIFLVSSIPSLTPPGARFKASDKVAHVIEYSLLGALLHGALAGKVGRSRFMEFLFLVTVGASIGALDEVYQGMIPGRSMSIYDWYADIAGTALGVIVMSSVYRRRSTGVQEDRAS